MATPVFSSSAIVRATTPRWLVSSWSDIQLNLFVGPEAPKGPTVRLKMVVAYDGTDFRGLAPNPGVRTVVGELTRVLTPYLGHPPDFVMSGRTDAGVHASGQVLSFDVAEPLADAGRITRVVNVGLSPEVVVTAVEPVDQDFSARFSATGRCYHYTVLNRPIPDPFMARTSWMVTDPLDLAAMRLACDPILGERDFSSFCRRPKTADGTEVSLIRRVDAARWDDLGDGVLRFEIRGSAFCHQMVRSIVGFHVAVGLGRRSAGELLTVLAARDRNKAASLAPSCGLNLVAVSY